MLLFIMFDVFAIAMMAMVGGLALVWGITYTFGIGHRSNNTVVNQVRTNNNSGIQVGGNVNRGINLTNVINSKLSNIGTTNTVVNQINTNTNSGIQVGSKVGGNISMQTNTSNIDFTSPTDSIFLNIEKTFVDKRGNTSRNFTNSTFLTMYTKQKYPLAATSNFRNVCVIGNFNSKSNINSFNKTGHLINIWNYANIVILWEHNNIIHEILLDNFNNLQYLKFNCVNLELGSVSERPLKVPCTYDLPNEEPMCIMFGSAQVSLHFPTAMSY